MRIFDLHCDTITAVRMESASLRENDFHIDLKRLKKADALAQCFAIFTHQEWCKQHGVSPYDCYREMRDLFYREMQENADMIAPAFSSSDVLENDRKGLMSGILTMEAGEPLEGKPERVAEFKKDGVRMITLTWNFENEIGYPNLTSGHLKLSGREIVDAMNALGVLVDVSHLSDDGFWDCIELSGGKHPVVASHSDARALCPHSRNLTDEMLRALGNTGGIVGVNYYSEFLRENTKDTRMEDVLRHTLHLIDKAGIDHVALGSDYDGIESTLEWKDVSGTPRLLDYLHKKISWDDLEKITHKNALRVFA